MAKYDIHIENTSQSYQCADTHSLLEGMECLGKKGIAVGCRNGGCGVCKVHITSGTFTSRVMSRAHVSAQEESQGCVLACRVKPTSNISLQVIGKIQKAIYRIAQSGQGAQNT